MKKGMDLDHRRRNLLQARKVVVDECRAKGWVAANCKTEAQVLGWIEFRLARLEDERIEGVGSEEEQDTAYAITPRQNFYE
jgi:hypothetical protein